MKQNCIHIVLILLLTSCSSNSYKSQLLGNWFFYENPKHIKHLQELMFYPDSVVIDGYWGKVTTKWKANKQQIHLYDIQGPISKSEISFEYQLINNDLLHLKVVDDTTIHYENVIKAQSAIEFLQKDIQLEIDLPEKKEELIMLGNDYAFNFMIYAGYENGILKFKTDNHPDLSNLNNEVLEFKESIDYRPFSQVKFFLVADKKIPDNEMDSLKQILNQTLIKRMYRIYKNDSIDYKKNLFWYGALE